MCLQPARSCIGKDVVWISNTDVRRATQVTAMVASMQGHVMHRCGGVHLRLGLFIKNAWGVLTSHHTQSFPMAGRRCWTVHREGPSPLMAASPLQLEFGVTGQASTTGLPPISELRGLSEIGGFEASSGEEGRLQEFFWQHFFSDPTQWRDYRRGKPTPRHPDFGHKESKVTLWLDNRHKPAWVDSQLATWDAGMKTPPESVATSVEGQGAFGRLAAYEGHLEIGMCRKLCEDGQITDAVDALNLLVQRGCHVDNNLFYLVLKRCIALKDVVLGRRIHALTIKSGYEGDAFLATHLIGLYDSHGRLEEAKRVFSKVSTPSSYNWAAMIFACARHGEAAEAIRLYRQMRESSSVAPTDRIYVAVLKACAAAGDLVAGKDVHAHILESAGKPNVFVQTGLVNMYAKCGSLEDARSLFDKLAQRDVVTWTAMIAGYTQQGMGQEALSLYSSMKQEGLNPPNSVTFVCLLQACASVGVEALHQGKQLHAQIAERGLQEDVVLGNSLVNMYAKCGSLEDARSIFDRLQDRNVVTWNALLGGYAQQGMGQEALSLYDTMQREGLIPPDSVTFVCILQACASVGIGAVHQGKQLHAQIRERGLQDDGVVGGSLVNMYAKCGSLEEARSMFDRLRDRDVVTWTAMIAGYAQQGMGQEALTLYTSMQQEGIIPPNDVTFLCLLQACASVGVGALPLGKQLYAQIEERGLQDDVVLGASLVNMFAKCGSLDDARIVFDRLPHRNVVTWNSMLAAYAQQGMGQEALTLYSSMQRDSLSAPNTVTFVCVLQACASVGVGALPLGKQLHAQVEERGLQDDVVLGNSLVNMYAKCGSLEEARSVFDSLPERNVVTWNALLAGYAQQGMGQEAISVYSSMQLEENTPPDSVTFVCLLQACASIGSLQRGKQLHAQMKERGLHGDVVLGTCLIDMYAKCGCLEDARSMFDTLPDRNVVTWNAMLAGYAQQGMGQEALTLHSSMQEEGITPPDSVTFVCLLQACASVGVGALHQGKQLHAQTEERGLQEDVVVGGSLVNMYVKCGCLEEARSVFDRLPYRNVVTWNAMLAGYVQQGMGQEALTLHSSMQQEGVTQPDSVTFLCLLEACAIVAALPLGKQLHAQIKERGLQADAVVGAALVNMYAKCGSMFDSQELFDSLPERSIEAWGALTGGYTRQGDTEVVFDLLDRMRLEGIQPNGIVFLSVLTVCSHAGLVDKGWKYFNSMRTDFDISPNVKHYTCMIDLLGRAGHLKEALQMTKTMPFPPDGTVWLTLLGACRKWKAVEIGRQAFEFAVSVDGKDAAPYVLMANIYASAEMWEEAREMQARRVKCGAWKKPGQSWWIDAGGVVHTFVVGDKKHPESKGIYARLEQLVPRMKKEGYVAHLDSSLRDTPDDEKEAGLCGHSEKLAIAYALNRTPEGTTVRVVKNLRVCVDCHTATAYISKVEQRTIICRDASRFHVFKEGKCSCGDYW